MNEYDSNRIFDIVKKIGYEKSNDQKHADCYVINTCHIRDKAKEKVFHEVGRVKKIYSNKNKPVMIIAGCVAQAENQEMLKREPYIDIVIGPQSYHKINKILNNFQKNKKEDQTTNEFRSYVNKAINITLMDDIEVINLVRNDKIDILFDLMGLTSNHRLSLYKNRLAPTQISWCGYLNTTGLKEMDYMIADKNIIPPEEQNLYSEKIIYLDDIWNCHVGYDLKRSKYPSPSLRNKFLTFGSFNNFNKINDNVIDVWSKILKQIKNSKLILKSSNAVFRSTMAKKFKKNDVLNSIEFISYKGNFNDHLNEYKKIDVALDTFPHNGVTTSFEAIWMGVPVLTMKGFNFSSRCGESINKNINLNGLIANNEQDYVDKAVLLSENIDKIEKFRNEIYDNALRSPLFDQKKFVNQFFTSLENYIIKK